MLGLVLVGSPDQSTRERRAYVCTDKNGVHQRVFLRPGEKIPRCEIHGVMYRQTNMPYRKDK